MMDGEKRRQVGGTIVNVKQQHSYFSVLAPAEKLSGNPSMNIQEFTAISLK